MRKGFLTLAIALTSITFGSVASATEGYYRDPDASGQSLVFSAEGDLWRLDNGAAQAVRLTTHEGIESQAAVSPDGEWVAFSASFDGLRQVYVMPIAGGAPKQVTFELAGVAVRGWSPDGRILYTSRNMEGSSRVRELRLVAPQTTDVERIPLLYATTGTFSDDGKTLFFARHGVTVVGDNARMYRGGGMSQLWRYEMGSNSEARRIAADFDGPFAEPMYWQGRIYFVSDKSGYDNIWSVKPDGQDIQQHSEFSGWQLRGASLRDGVIRYQRGADIYAFDIANGREAKQVIDLASDRDSVRLRWIDDPVEYLDSAHMGGAGERVAMTARGQISIAGTDILRRVDLQIPAWARAREAVMNPKGDQIYTILDQGERGEIWRFAADGSDSGEQLTDDASARRWRLYMSPDGKWLVHDDMQSRLWKLNLETLENSLIVQTAEGSDDDFGGVSFSPDGRYIAFSQTGDRFAGTVVTVHDTQSGANHVVTGAKYTSFSPTFSRDGNWLYFLSSREFNASPGAPWGDRNMGTVFNDRDQIFALALQPDIDFPFDAPNELTIAKAATKAEAEAEKEDSEQATAEDAIEEAKAVDVDWQAARHRLYQVPVSAANYAQLQAGKDRLYVVVRSDNGPTLKSVAIGHDDVEVTTFADGVGTFELSSDASKILLQRRGKPSLAIVDAAKEAPKDLSDHAVRVSGWRLPIDPTDEWQQMFLDGWRMHRDFAFDADMRGVNWTAVRDKLLPLAARIGHRSELTDLFSQMASEIGILHSQVRGGDQPSDEEKGTVASLGARFAPVDGGLSIVQIYQGETDRPDTLGPLHKPGKDIRVGDVITAVNNRAIASRADLERALMHQVGEQVLLDFSRDGDSMREVVVPITARDDAMMRYREWVADNATTVADASDGEIGYLHMQAMGGGDVGAFARDFFAQNHLDGLIVDVRDNNGGSVDSWIIQQFLRRVWSYWKFDPDSKSYGNMQETFRGHFVVLINAGTYSDGETFAAGVKALDLAPLIGERTAGAGIWLSGRNSLADGGMSRIAESPQYGMDGRWLIEGYGVTPDIEVVNMPNAQFNGHDEQLLRAIQYLEQKIEAEPILEMNPQPLPPMGQHGQDIRD